MKREKRVWISLILVFILIMVLSGCSGVTGPKTAKINITIEPNPVPYSSENENWPLTIILEESNGVGVTISSLRWDEYNQEEQLIYTTIVYETNEEGITSLFGSNYLPAFSSLQKLLHYNLDPEDGFAQYIILTIEGVDDNNNPVEATGRADLLPQ